MLPVMLFVPSLLDCMTCYPSGQRDAFRRLMFPCHPLHDAKHLTPKDVTEVTLNKALFDSMSTFQKNMNEEALRAHLNELDAKGMNTRGVLRKLLQQYCREGNLAAAKEIADRCQKEGVSQSNIYFARLRMLFNIVDIRV
jgi:hypothetical protein